MNFQELQKLSGSYQAARAVQVACDLKLFDVLASERRTAKGIAGALKTDPRATELLCNALAGIGLLEKSNGRFSNTGVAQKYLVTNAPLYYGWIIRHGSRLWNSWGRLEESIKSGQSVEMPSMSERDEADVEAFIMGMHSIITARGDADLLVDRLGLENIDSMLDLAGGPGTFPIVFCQRHKRLKAVVFDLPETVKIARRNLLKFPDAAERISFVEGDYFKDELPAGFDLVFVSNIIHSCSEEENAELMGKVYKSLNKGGRVVIKDHILSEDLTHPPYAAVFSLNMLLHANGRDYSFSEVEGWLKSAGFAKVSMLDLPEGTAYGVVIGSK